MTKEELKVKVDKQLSIINDANDEICSYVNVPDAMFVGLKVLFREKVMETILARLK